MMNLAKRHFYQTNSGWCFGNPGFAPIVNWAELLSQRQPMGAALARKAIILALLLEKYPWIPRNYPKRGAKSLPILVPVLDLVVGSAILTK